MAARDTSIATPDTLYRIDMTPVAESTVEDPVPMGQRSGFNNYYLPHTTPGLTGVLAWDRVVYTNVWEMIDLNFWSGSGGQKMAFVCWPGSDPANIFLQFEGQDSIVKDVEGDLQVYLDEKWIELREAVAYQFDGSTVVPVYWNAEYEVADVGGVVNFLFDTYDPDLPLVLLIGRPPAPGGGGGPVGNHDWNTFMGHYNTRDVIQASAAKSDGTLYIAGHTEDFDFPAFTGPTPYTAEFDMIYGHYSYDPADPPNDAKNVFTTYFGGSDVDKARDILLRESEAAAIVVGWASSTDLPIAPLVDPLDGSFWQGDNKGGKDGVIAKFSADDGTLLRSTYFGGEGDDAITAITRSINSDLYFTGSTSTALGDGGNCGTLSTGFPTCDPGSGAYYQNILAGTVDAFFARMNASFDLIHSTYFGGGGDDIAYDIALSTTAFGASRLVICGRTDATIPAYVPTGAFHLNHSGSTSGWLMSFTTAGQPHWSTHVHGVRGLQAVIADGDRLYLTGTTDEQVSSTATGCTATPGSLCLCDPGGNATVNGTTWAWDQYLMEFDLPTGTLSWATMIGGDTDEGAYDVAVYRYFNTDQHPWEMNRWMELLVDDVGNLYVMGHCADWNGTATTYPTVYVPGLYNRPWYSTEAWHQTDVTLNAFQSDRSLYWSTLYGVYTPHTDDANDNFFADYRCDHGTAMAYSPGKALYMVGVSGTDNIFDDVCPSPGNSYCEGYDLVTVPYDGFIARFNLQNVILGVPEDAPPHSIIVLPNPTSDQIIVLSHTQGAREILVTDVLGRAIIRQTVQGDSVVRVHALSDACYSVLVLDANGRVLEQGRFIKQ